jgi:hypothetical protein
MSLPLAQRKPAPISVLTSGVLSGPRTFLSGVLAFLSARLERQLGYAVETRLAMAALAAHSPEALAWWQENTPHVMQPRRYFAFHREVGHVREAEAVA